MQFPTLHNSLTKYLESSGKDCSADVFQFTIPPDHKFGDVCINIFPAVKATKLPPPQLANEVLEFMKNEDYVTDGNIQGGFVNLFVTDGFYQGELSEWELPKWEKRNERIIVDYNQPNIGKPLHIGHLCTPLFGQATINLLRTMGYEVIGDMHQGDWGGIFGKLITGWKYFGDENAFEKDAVNHLLQIYIAITEKLEKDPEIEQECRNAFKLLSEGDEDSMKLWRRFTDKSLAGVQKVMSEFGVHPNVWIGESFYEGLPLPKLGNWPDLTPDNTMSAVVDEMVEKGIATKNEDESVGIVFDDLKKKEEIINNKEGFEEINNQKPKTKNTSLPSCILQKRDGTHGYLASDLAAIKYRLKNWSPARILYFVDNRQALHFRQLFETAKNAWLQPTSPGEGGWENELKEGGLEMGDGRGANLTGSGNAGGLCELTHAANGFVSLTDGAMSTRHGRVIFLKDLIGESFDRVKKILLERERNISDADTKAVALGAIIYSFLGQDRERDWTFEWDKVLAFEGNSGPYLQYTYVRWKKILTEIQSSKQAGVNSKQDSASLPSTVHSLLSVYDKDLILDILSFNDVLENCGTSYKFHLLVSHLATMARHLNALYVNTPKLKDTSEVERAARVSIIRQCLSIIEYTAQILGMPLPEEM